MTLVRPTAQKCRSTLLIVDDQVPVLRALRRVTGLYFENVLTATCPLDAEYWLKTERPPLLLCDYWLGDAVPAAVDLIPVWRQQHSCLRRVALMTGTHPSALELCPAIDGIFQKPIDPEEVSAFLVGGEFGSRHCVGRS